MIYTDFLERFTDWRPETLYWQRFSIAEKFGKLEIQTTYDEIFKEAKKDYRKLAELVVILDHKSLQHSENIMSADLCELYSGLLFKTRKYAETHLKKDELEYFFGMTGKYTLTRE